MLDLRQNDADTWETMRVIYDLRGDRSELQRQVLEPSVPIRISKIDSFWWKDVAYIDSYVNGREGFEVVDLKTSVWEKAEISASALVPKILECRVVDVDYGWRRGLFLDTKTS